MNSRDSEQVSEENVLILKGELTEEQIKFIKAQELEERRLFGFDDCPTCKINVEDDKGEDNGEDNEQ